MTACAYEGWVQHRRLRPFGHELRRKLFMVYLDLDELPQALDGIAGFSARRAAPAWFRRADHFSPQAPSLSDAVRDLVAASGASRPAGPVRLLTHMRYLGHCFNPVSFYYCYDEPGDRVQALVAEVTNTPWGIATATRWFLPGDRLAGTVPKQLHVSPFMPMDQTYAWRAQEPAEDLDVSIASSDEEGPVFEARLTLRRRELSPALLLRHPAVTVSGLASIYVEALKLWRKGATYHARP